MGFECTACASVSSRIPKPDPCERLAREISHIENSVSRELKPVSDKGLYPAISVAWRGFPTADNVRVLQFFSFTDVTNEQLVH